MELCVDSMNVSKQSGMSDIWKKRLAWWAVITLPIALVAVEWRGNDSGLLLLGFIWVFNLNYLEDRLNEEQKGDNSH